MKYLKKILKNNFLKNNYIKILIAEILILGFSTIIVSFNLKAKQKTVDVTKKNLTTTEEEIKEKEYDYDLAKTQNEIEEENFEENEPYNEPYYEKTKENIEKKDKTKDRNIYMETISSYFTKMSNYREKEKNRIHNIKKAAEYLNNIEIKPNEEFSFHRAVWAKGKSKSYKYADTITQNGMDKGLGGGICQVVSTLFVAALKANLKITQRSSHSRIVNYIPLGLDASYYTGVKDLKFKNNLKNKIKIKANYTDSYVEIKILGTPTKEEKKINIIIHPAKIFKETSKIVETNVLVEKEIEGEIANSINFKSSYFK